MKYLTLCILILASQATWADMRCSLKSNYTAESNTEHHWKFDDTHLICKDQTKVSNSNQAESYPYNELLVVRGNIKEISAKDFIYLHHSAGFSLVQKRHPNSNQTNHHLDFIPLEQFQSIQANMPSPKAGIPNIQNLVDQVDTSRWLADIVTLSGWSRRTGQAGNESAANWIATQFNSMDLDVSMPSFQVGQNNTQNIMGVQAGLVRPDDWYVVGGHMDSIPSSNAPGAVDNASGCAAVIEMARIASQYTFEATLIFICYSGEEQGLIGSELHADTLINEGDDDKIKAVLTLDMIGYTSDTDHELLIESSASHQGLMNDMAQNAATYAPGLTVQTTTNYFGSDHVSYINNGMPGVLSIDVDWGIYPDYHRSSDLPENINTTQGGYIIITNLATLVEKATVIGSSDLIFSNGFD